MRQKNKIPILTIEDALAQAPGFAREVLINVEYFASYTPRWSGPRTRHRHTLSVVLQDNKLAMMYWAQRRGSFKMRTASPPRIGLMFKERRDREGYFNGVTVTANLVEYLTSVVHCTSLHIDDYFDGRTATGGTVTLPRSLVLSAREDDPASQSKVVTRISRLVAKTQKKIALVLRRAEMATLFDQLCQQRERVWIDYMLDLGEKAGFRYHEETMGHGDINYWCRLFQFNVPLDPRYTLAQVPPTEEQSS